MTTIQKCFRKAGILDLDFAVVRRVTTDPFEDLDEESPTTALQALITLVQTSGSACSVEHFIDADDGLPTCMDDWGEN